MQTNLYGWAISQKLPVNGFMWNEYLSDFSENFIKNYDENCDVGYFLEVNVEYQKNYLILIKTYHFYQKEKNQKKQKNLFVVQKTKKNMSYT